MRIKKKSLFFLESAYSICALNFNGDTFLIAGSEEKEGDLLLFSHKDFKTSKIIEGIGRFMTVLPSKDSSTRVINHLNTHFLSVKPNSIK
jgi:hypothetical protein